MLIQKQITLGDFQSHCYLLACTETGDALLLDAGDEPSLIEQLFLKSAEQMQVKYGQKLTLKFLAHTHAHLDHMGATRAIRESMIGRAAKILIHPDDEALYGQLKMQGALFGRQYVDPLPVDGYLRESEPLWLGKQKLSVLHTPGHSPGSICLFGDGLLFAGDTIFRGSVGRTDFWGGDSRMLQRSLQQKILSLPDHLRILPGHGPETTVGIEKNSNPYCRFT